MSEASKQDILRFFQIPDEKVTVIYNAIAEHFFEAPPSDQIARVRERYQLGGPIRDVCRQRQTSQEPRPLESRPLPCSDRTRRTMTFACSSRAARSRAMRRCGEAVHRYNLHRHVRFLGYQSEKTLGALYRLADVFVFPSLYEGFGLPPLEAMAERPPPWWCRTSRRSPRWWVTPGVLVNPYDAESIADGIRRVLDDGALSQDLSTRGLARARSFSWPTSVKRIRDIYHEVATET